MKLTLETRALGWATLAALLALGGALLVPYPIRAMMSADATAPVAKTDPAFSSKITTSAELVGTGRDYFAQSCAQCHADDAHGDEGPDLHNLAISNARIAATIKKGIKGEMPTFAKRYNDQQIAALVSYLRSLK